MKNSQKRKVVDNSVNGKEFHNKQHALREKQKAANLLSVKSEKEVINYYELSEHSSISLKNILKWKTNELTPNMPKKEVSKVADYFGFVGKSVATLIAFSTIGTGLFVNANQLQAQEVETIKNTKDPKTSVGIMKSVLSLSLSKDIEKDPTFTYVEGTNKIVVDIEGIDRKLDVPSVLNNDPLLEHVSSRMLSNRIRLLVDTKQPVKYGFVKDDKKLHLIFEESKVFENAGKQESLKTKVEPIVQSKVEESQLVVPKVVAPIAVDTSVKVDTVVSSQPNIKIKEVETIVQRAKIQKPVMENKGNLIPLDLLNKHLAEKNNVISKDTKEVFEQFNEIKRINLRKENNAAVFVVEFANKGVKPVIEKKDTRLFIDLPNVSIPNEFQKRVVTDKVGTLVQNMDVSMQGSNGKIILDQKDNWDYSYSLVENQLIITVRNQVQKDEEKKYVGKTLTINFQDMDVRSIIQVIADFTGLNIISSDSISGNMTLRLKDVPWDQALDLILESRNLQKVKEGNVIWIATRQEVTEINKTKLELKNQNSQLEPLKLEFFQINYYKAEDLKGVIEGVGKKTTKDNKDGKVVDGNVSLLSNRGTIGVDQRNNILFVQDTEENIKEIKKVIKKLDISTRQVLVEAKIVIADSQFGKELGAKFGVRGSKVLGRSNVLGIGSNAANAGTMATNPGGVTSNLNSNLGASGLNAVVPGAIGFTLLNLISGNALDLELSALEQDQRGKVLSNPRLLTSDNKRAVIEQGTEVPYVTPGSANSPPSVAFKKAVLSLGVTPQIAPNGKVLVDLQIRKDTIGQLINIQGGGQIPAIDTKNIDTQVTLNDGQTVVLGGVYEISSQEDISKIPFFGDIPFLGNLFKHKTNSQQKGELLIFLTPHVIDDQILDGSNQEEIDLVLEKKKNQ